MKDTDKVELTVGDVKRAAGKCGTAKEVLKEMFPAVFGVPPPEWEEIELSECRLDGGFAENPVTLCVKRNGENPFAIILSRLPSGESGCYRVAKGRLWRRREA